MRTFFDSTQSQDSKSEFCAQEFYVAMHIKTPFDNALYLSSLSSHVIAEAPAGLVWIQSSELDFKCNKKSLQNGSHFKMRILTLGSHNSSLLPTFQHE